MILNIGHGQNLVPNGDFESYTTCPNNYSQIDKATGWVKPTDGTSDYMNACASSASLMSVPTNYFGTQAAHSGNGYAGFLTAANTFPSVYREYIQIALTDYLIAGHTYYFEMYLSLSDNSCLATNVGAYFSNTAVSSANSGYLNYPPQVLSAGYVTDKTGWTKVSACYRAAGGEHYVTIGNFQPPSTSNTTYVGSCGTGFWSNSSYYYIDDVLLIKSSRNILGNDTNLCGMNPFSMTLNASASGSTKYLWNTGDTNSSISITQPGTYWVHVDSSSCSDGDTISILNNKPNPNLGPDTTLCFGNSLSLHAYVGVGTYKWEDGSYGTLRTISSPGTYWLDVTILGCKTRDSLVVNYTALPPLNLGPDTMMCRSNPVTYQLNYPGAKYLWSTGDTNSALTITNPGRYWGEINNSGCRNRDTVNVSVSPLSPFSFGPDTTLCTGQSLLLNATTNGATSYKWNTNSTGQVIYISTPGLYWAEAKDANCRVRDSINVVFNPLPVVNLGNDTTICGNNSLTLDAGNPGANYLWSTNDTTEIISINKMGMYSVKVTKNNCSSSDSLKLSIQNPPPLNLGNDTTICEGSVLWLDAASPGSKYKWQDGSTNSKLLVFSSGKYLVTVTNGFCTVSDSIFVYGQLKPYLNIGTDSSYCFNQSILLDASQTAADKYLWQDGSVFSSYVANTAGTYWVEIKKAFCSVRDSVLLSQKPLPVNNLGTDKKICKENTLTLDAGNPGSTYLWNDQTTLQTKNVKAPGLFFVRITNKENCFVFDSVSLDTFTSPIVALGNDSAFCDG
ncbi:MAG: hypothetical protein ACHQK8_05555, partial [Bacteroidia bacterium]